MLENVPLILFRCKKIVNMGIDNQVIEKFKHYVLRQKLEASRITPFYQNVTQYAVVF